MQTVMTEAAVSIDPDQLHEKVLKAYEVSGFPREIVGSWAISENDVKDFVSFAMQAQPKKILEVGTYVGVSTMLLALACPEANIFTVDPDLSLEVEMSSARSDTRGVNGHATTHAVAREAANRLGVSKRLNFVRGGFAVGDTFSSILQTEGSKVKVVGPELCAEEGPFDFIFVDGLHSAEAVSADLELAATALTPNGVIVLHDCIGYWGASVRSGVLRFLRKHPDFLFTHPSYSEIYKSVGVLAPRQSTRGIGFPVRSPLRKDDLTTGLRATIARFNATLAGARPLVEIGFGEPVLDTALVNSRTEYSYVSLNGLSGRGTKGGPQRLLAAVAEQLNKVPGSAVFSADLMDFAPNAAVESLLTMLKKEGAPLVLALTPPGETGVAGPQSRSIASVIDLAEKQDLAVYALPALDIEFERYALLPQSRDLGTTSLFTNFVVIATADGYVDGMGRSLARLSAESAAEQEQLELQRVHLAAGYRRYYNDRNELLISNGKAGDRVRLMESKVRGLEADLDKANARSEELADGADRNSAEALKLAARFADLSESFRDFEAHRLAQQVRCASLELELEAERRSRERAEAAIVDLETSRASSEVELASATEQIHGLRQELESSQAEAAGLEQQLVIGGEENRDRFALEREKREAAEAAERAVKERLSTRIAELERDSQVLAGKLDAAYLDLAQIVASLESQRTRTADVEAALAHERARAVEVSRIAIDVFEAIDFADDKLQTQERLLGVSAEFNLSSDGGLDQTIQQLALFRQRLGHINDALYSQLSTWKSQALDSRRMLDAVHASTSWKLTAPLRSASLVARHISKVPGWFIRRCRASLLGRRLVRLAEKLDAQLGPTGLRVPVFDERYYVASNMDVPADAAMRHYLMFGEKEGRRPTKKFDPAFYIRQYPDVAVSGVSPLLHFLNHGILEGRSPSAELHPLGGLALQANVTPLEYFARS